MKALQLLQNDIVRGSLSHAYLVVGGSDSQVESLISRVVEAKNIEPIDLIHLAPLIEEGKKREIKVDQVRELIRQVNMTPHGSFHLVVIHNIEELNVSSGNILLKTLEEPPLHALFFLLAKNDSVIPTIKSRCRILKINSDIEENKDTEVFASFLKRTFLEISTDIEKIVKEEKTDLFLKDAQNFCQTKMLETKKQAYAELISEVVKARRAISNNVNSRLVLENIALKLKKLY